MLEHPTKLTVQFVERCRDRFDTCLTTQRDSERGFEFWDHGAEILCCSEVGQIDWGVLYLSMSKDMVYMVGCSWFVMRASPSPGHLILAAVRKCPGGPVPDWEHLKSLLREARATTCYWGLHTNDQLQRHHDSRDIIREAHCAPELPHRITLAPYRATTATTMSQFVGKVCTFAPYSEQSSNTS